MIIRGKTNNQRTHRRTIVAICFILAAVATGGVANAFLLLGGYTMVVDDLFDMDE